MPGPCRSRRASTCSRPASARRVGVKIFGKDLAEIERLAREVEAVLRNVPGTASAYAERVNSGYFLNIIPDRDRIARYGLSVEDVQETIAMALGAEPVTTTVEGRERYTVVMRFPRDCRSDPEASPRMCWCRFPAARLFRLARSLASNGPRDRRRFAPRMANSSPMSMSMFATGTLAAMSTRRAAPSRTRSKFPPGYSATWSGPVRISRTGQRDGFASSFRPPLLIIFLLLYLNFRRLSDTLIVMLSLPFALVGGLWLMDYMQFNQSVATVVGFIALAGVAAETGVVMLIYLQQRVEGPER